MKFNIIIAVWGESYVSCLCNIALPSLAFSKAERVYRDRHRWKFLIYTRPDYQQEIDDVLEKYFPGLDRTFYEINPGSFGNHYLAMADAHHHAARLCAQESARGIIAVPDAVFSQGCLAHIVKLAERGKRAIMTVGPRLRQVSAFEPIKAILDAEGPIPSRRLVEVLLDHLHPEMERYNWNSDDFSSHPTMLFWSMHGGYINRNFHLHPLMVDFSSVALHGSLVHDTIDGEFIGASIGIWDDIHVVQDSDDLLVCTLTPDNVYYSAQSTEKANADLLRSFAYLEPVVNPLHRWFLTKAIKIHCRDLDDSWRAFEQETGHLVFEILKRSPSAQQQPTSSSEPLWARLKPMQTLMPLAAAKRKGGWLSKALLKIKSHL